jgi:hypothetical protein
VGTIRTLARSRHVAILWLIAAALLVRAFMPSGYMLTWASAGPTIEFCNGMAATPAMPMHNAAMMSQHAGGDHGSPAKETKDQLPCAFAAAVAHASVGADPALLAIALLFILATVAFGPAAQRRFVKARAHLRPPLRGPPAH